MKPNCSILLVEDDANDQYFVSRAFQDVSLPARLDAVSDGQGAIDFLLNARDQAVRRHGNMPSIVLLDLNLPRKSGHEVLKWIRRESPWKTIVVIVLTSSTSEEDMHQAYLSGANAYVLKPANPAQLRDFAQCLKDFWLTWSQIPPFRS